MGINKELLEKFEKQYDLCSSNKVVESAIAKVGVEDASLNQESIRRHNFQFSEKTKKGEITNQKSSGRCWIFAALNTARVEAMEKFDIKTFEFSQTYTFFWDKLERANFFLESIIETVAEPVNSRLVAHLLTTPIQDGGQWDMVAGLFEKYGTVPKEAMPDTFHSTNSAPLNKVINNYLRFFATELREMAEKGSNAQALQSKKEEQLSVIYNILVKAFGKPPVEVTYEFVDSKEKFHRLPSMTPQEFFKTMIAWNLDDKISLINAPTADKPYGNAYTVKYLGSIKGVRPIRYVNAPIEALKKAAIASIQSGEPVWFGCDMGQNVNSISGVMDHKMYLTEELIGTQLGWTKAKRLEFGESCLTHAMVFTGVNLDENGNPTHWQVENSWGKDRGKDGEFSMSDEWFSEFVYQIMIDKKYVEKEWLTALEKPVIELEPWDPIGTLA